MAKPKPQIKTITEPRCLSGTKKQLATAMCVASAAYANGYFRQINGVDEYLWYIVSGTIFTDRGQCPYLLAYDGDKLYMPLVSACQFPNTTLFNNRALNSSYTVSESDRPLLQQAIEQYLTKLGS